MFSVNEEGSRGEGAPRARASNETQSQKPATIAGGYKLIQVRELAAVWYLQDTGQLRISDVRAYMACHEAIARRCVVESGKPAKFTSPKSWALQAARKDTLRRPLLGLKRRACSPSASRPSPLPGNSRQARSLRRSLPPTLPASRSKQAAPARTSPHPPPHGRRARRSLIATILADLLWGLYRSGGGRPGERKAGQGGFDPTAR